MKKVLLLLIVSLVLSACGSEGNSLVGNWILTGYGPEGSASAAVTDSQASLTFSADGTVTGTSGCNGFGGEYKLDGDQITFSELISTLMACDGRLMIQEGTMFKVLNGAASFQIEGDMLTVTNDGAVLVFAASKQ